VILEWDAEVERAERNPGGFSTPTRLDDLAAKWERVEKRATSLGGALLLEPGDELELTAHGNAEIHVVVPFQVNRAAKIVTEIDPPRQCGARERERVWRHASIRTKFA
jgi:hypothetical protein